MMEFGFGNFGGFGAWPTTFGEQTVLPAGQNAFRGFGGFGGFGGPNWQQLVLSNGWGYAVIVPTSYQADNGAGLTRGIIGLCNKGQPRKPDDWGALRAWAWGASRALDYFETDPAVDAKQVGIEGLSRYGKATLVTMAYDQRFAIALVGSSGEGGAKLSRRNWGELVENLTGTGEYHWMAGNFLKYGGPLTPGDLPVDAHELIALCAPRPVFISYGAASGRPGVEGTWVDQHGSFMAAVAAGPVYRLLGKKDLGVPGNYLTAPMPPINTALTNGELAWRQHDGGHTDAPNWPAFLAWADRYIHGPSLARQSACSKRNNFQTQVRADRSSRFDATKHYAKPCPIKRFCLCVFAFAALLTAAAADHPSLPFVSPMFSDNMVLQRGKPDPIWGWAKPGEIIKVEIAGHTAKAVAGADGRWQAEIQPPAPGGPYTLKITGPDQTVEFHEVLVGDVWLCGGQSNMELGIGLVNNAAEEIKAANHPEIRLFLVNHKVSYAPAKVPDGTWKICSPQTISDGGWGGFSAVAYFFGRRLQQDIHVPVGLIEDCVGGSRWRAG